MVLPNWCVGTTLVHSTRNDPLYFPLSTSKHSEKSLNIAKTTLDVPLYISKAAPDTLNPPCKLELKMSRPSFEKIIGAHFCTF